MCYPVLLRGVLKSRLTFWRLFACSINSSLAFFLISNTAVWLFSPLYTQDLAGLTRCFTFALPFLRNTLGGDLVFTAILFGTYALIVAIAHNRSGRLAYARVQRR
jgi:hypothetical protein